MLFCNHANQAGMEECRAGRRLTQANQPCANDPRTEPGTYSFIVPSEMCLHHFNWNNNKNPQRLQTLKCGLLRLPLMPPTLFLTYSNYFEAFFPSKLRKLSERQEAWAGLSVSLKDGQAASEGPWPIQVPRLSLVAMTCGDLSTTASFICADKSTFPFYSGETNVLETCMWYYCLRPKLPSS